MFANLDVFDELESMMRAMRGGSSAAVSGGVRTHLSTDEDGWTLTADLPGVGANEVAVKVEHDVLTLSSKRSLAVPDGYEPVRRERRDWDFERSFRLGPDVDPAGVQAAFSDGRLSVTLPRRAASGPRSVDIHIS